MKKLILMSLVLISANVFSRGMSSHSCSHSSSHSSFHSSSHSYVSHTGSVSHVNSAVHVNSTRSTPVRVSQPISRSVVHTTTSSVRPTYHYSPNVGMWYFLRHNNRTHRNDTIKGKSKSDLQNKLRTK